MKKKKDMKYKRYVLRKTDDGVAVYRKYPDALFLVDVYPDMATAKGKIDAVLEKYHTEEYL